MFPTESLAMDKVWVDRAKYFAAEKRYYERLAGARDTVTPLTAEFVKARQRIKDMKRQVDEGAAAVGDGIAVALGATVQKDSGNNRCEMMPASKGKKSKGKSPAAKDNATVMSAPSVSLPEPQKNVEPPLVSVEIETEKSVENSPPPPLVVSESSCNMPSIDLDVVKVLEKQMLNFQDVLNKVQSQLESMDARLTSIEKSAGSCVKPPAIAICPAKPPAACAKPAAKHADDDDDVDLFGSDSEEESEEAAKVKAARVAAYAAKKSNKPALIAKSSILLDVKPWDDETDMKQLEAAVRKIECDGLLWGASKLVPLAYGICKLQINCVVEDEKVSIDWLQETIEANEDFVQSVDIAAFNKI